VIWLAVGIFLIRDEMLKLSRVMNTGRLRYEKPTPKGTLAAIHASGLSRKLMAPDRLSRQINGNLQNKGKVTDRWTDSQNSRSKETPSSFAAGM
jgi:hypothetical protein